MDDKKIRDLIALAKIEEAFSLLFQLAEKINNNTYKDGIVILSARYHQLKHKQLFGIISSEESKLENNQILNGILETTAELFKYNSEITDNLVLREHLEIKIQELIYDSSNSLSFSKNITLGWYNTNLESIDNITSDFEDDNNLIWKIKSQSTELVGVNFFIDALIGKVNFEYMPLKFNEVNDNLIFYVIPMISTEFYIELGSEISVDPNNAFSPFRIRKVASQELGKWHKEEINFDFSNAPKVTSIVFAPRINEGSPRPNSGELKIRNIKIFINK